MHLGINLAMLGEVAQAGGWFARAQRLVDREPGDCPERGYLLLPLALRHEAAGEFALVAETAGEAAAIGERFGDRDLFALGAHVHGNALIRAGRLDEGFRWLDEAMLAAVGGELSPIVTGIVYCGAIAGCEEAYELPRAHEWTDALARWWEEQPDLVAFTGRCLAHRAEILQLHGDWPRALDEAVRARERCERVMNRVAAGQAAYQQAEVLRRQGAFAAAKEAYRDANACGRQPQPGLALLRLAEGDARAAAAAIRRVLAETDRPLERSRLLPAHAEIMVALGELDEARGSCRELAGIAEACPSAMLGAIAAHVQGSVELASGDANAAVVSLRRALQTWQQLAAPYEAARTRVLMAMACRALDDEDTATMELEAARAVFEELAARPALERLEALTAGRRARDSRPQRARARGAAAGRRRQHEPRDRGDARAERAHRRAPRPEHLRQAARLQPDGRDRLRVRARPRLTALSGQNGPWHPGCRLVKTGDAGSPAAS